MSTRRAGACGTTACVLLLSFCAVLAATACRLGGPAAGDEPSNLLLVTIDTLRADAVGCYGAGPEATPHLDALAHRGTRFETAWTVTPLTTPAHATLMTGLYPGAHGLRNNGRNRLSDEATTLAEILAAEGYRTGAMVAAFPVQRRFGLGQGFADFDEDFGINAQGKPAYQRRAEAVNRRAIPWLRAATQGDTPWFLWVHYYDPHDPYEPPEPFASTHAGNPYAGEVAYTDQALGNLLAVLEASGQVDRTVVLVAGDHGEGLGEHGESTHGVLVYEPMIRIPLVLAAPGRLPAGTVTDLPAGLADVMPTLLGLLGIVVPDGIQGANLGSALQGQPEESTRPLYCETFHPQEEFGWAPLRTLLVGHDKVILGPDVEWFDLENDPEETRNLAPDDPRGAEVLVQRLREMAGDLEAGGGEAPEAAISEEALEALASLGYVAGGAGLGGADPDLSGRHPREAIEDYEAFLRAGSLIQSQDYAGAISMIDDLLARDPDNVQFLYKRGLARLRGGWPEQGEADLRRLIERHPGFHLAYRELSSFYEREERWNEALHLWESLEATGGRLVDADLRKAKVLIGLDRLAEARRLMETRLIENPWDAETLTLLGNLEAREGHADSAIHHFRQAARTAPSDLQALQGLAEGLIGERRFGEALPVLDQALALAPADAGIHSRRSLVLAYLGRLPEALEEAREAARLDPDSPVIQQNLGSLLLEADLLEEADQVFARILSRNPDFLPALFSRGLVKMQRGDQAGAEMTFREVLARDPGHAGARHFLNQ